MAILAKWILGVGLILAGLGFAALVTLANEMSDGDRDSNATLALEYGGAVVAVAAGVAFLVL